MVAGKPLVRDGRLLKQDEYVLRGAADFATERVLARASAITGVDYLESGIGRSG
jgi:hypothetical protein